jgi:hypothetical protein
MDLYHYLDAASELLLALLNIVTHSILCFMALEHVSSPYKYEEGQRHFGIAALVLTSLAFAAATVVKCIYVDHGEGVFAFNMSCYGPLGHWTICHFW